MYLYVFRHSGKSLYQFFDIQFFYLDSLPFFWSRWTNSNTRNLFTKTGICMIVIILNSYGKL